MRMHPQRRGVSAYLAPKACGASARTPPLGVCTVEPVVATIHGVHAGRYSRKRRRATEETTNARE
ncbi:MAG: hypothetical protein ACO2PN_25345 [Pyrobaculum sp.]